MQNTCGNLVRKKDRQLGRGVEKKLGIMVEHER